MLSPFQQRKVILGYFRFDQDKDGVVGAGDLDGLAHHMAAYLGLADGSPGHDGLLRGVRELWDYFFKPADTDGDDIVTLSEHLASVDYFLNLEGIEQESQRVNNAIFDALDADGDGMVELNEFTAFVVAMSGTEEDARLAFGRLDSDGNGVLSSDEVTKAWFEYYDSDDPSAPGSYLFGRF